jgi:glycosyltransferase involved in cell wall biosynthesis
MYRDHKIGVLVPAYNEEELILETLCGIPEYVDTIFVINDASIDATPQLIREQQQVDARIVPINHETNRGLGQTLIDGYLASLDSDIDITAVMAGDNQMHPDDLPALLDRIIDENADYVKGNRLLHQDIPSMPRYRFIGNAALTILTKFATGYYSLMDPQCGYTAIRNTALRSIPITTMTRGYGYNADILCMLNIRGYKVKDVQVRPVYDREKSKIKLWKYIPKTSWLLIKLFFRRLWQRYVVLDFHPLVLFYLYAAFSIVLAIVPLSVRFVALYFREGEAPQTTLIILVFMIITTFQSILFAIWMDMDYNRIG